VPCASSPCTKVAADGYACSHLWHGRTPPPGRASAVLCQVESPPDGHF